MADLSLWQRAVTLSYYVIGPSRARQTTEYNNNNYNNTNSENWLMVD